MRREPRHSTPRGHARLEGKPPGSVSTGGELLGGEGGKHTSENYAEQADSNRRAHALESVLWPASLRL